jgi:hypothetical protein
MTEDASTEGAPEGGEGAPKKAKKVKSPKKRIDKEAKRGTDKR